MPCLRQKDDIYEEISDSQLNEQRCGSDEGPEEDSRLTIIKWIVLAKISGMNFNKT